MILPDNTGHLYPRITILKDRAKYIIQELTKLTLMYPKIHSLQNHVDNAKDILSGLGSIEYKRYANYAGDLRGMALYQRRLHQYDEALDSQFHSMMRQLRLIEKNSNIRRSRKLEKNISMNDLACILFED